MTEYKDKFTLDGRLRPGRSVTKAKVAKVKELFEGGYRGDLVAAARFTESISTSDAIFNAAHLVNLQVLPQFDDTERTWQQIAGTRPLPDFRPAVLQGVLDGGFEGLARDGVGGPDNPEGIAPVVAEGAPYPYATLGDVEAAYGRLKKRGFKVGWTWEARVNNANDAIDFFGQMPGAMLDVALDTEEWEVYQALLGGTTAATQLDAGSIYTGETVVANAPISKNAVIAAIEQRALRTVNGRAIKVNGGSNLIVPIGKKLAVQFALSQRITETTTGGFVIDLNDKANEIIGDITIIESEYVTGTQWFLVPKPGTYRRPLLELGRLRGQEAPELRVHNITGNYVGAGQVSPFEGSFDNDSIDLRLRYPLTGILWNETPIVWSTGAGS